MSNRGRSTANGLTYRAARAPAHLLRRYYLSCNHLLATQVLLTLLRPLDPLKTMQ